jgi:predicted lipid-binding transport protein (Tim44 family)
MKEPRRLLSHGATDFERQLLRAVSNERPSALLRSRMQRGLGLVGPLAWASSVKAMVGGVLSKLSGGVALGSIVAIGGVTAVCLIPSSESASSVELRPSEQLAAAPAERAALPALAPEVPRANAPIVPEPASPAQDSASAIVPPSAPEAPAAGGELDAASSDRQLREEIALIDTARVALQSGDREAARERLQLYRERFPEGILRREAKVLARRAEPKRTRR